MVDPLTASKMSYLNAWRSSPRCGTWLTHHCAGSHDLLSERTGLLSPCGVHVRARLIYLRGSKDALGHVAGRTSAPMLRAFTIATLVREQADTP